jgi:glycosyltransferase involved in cell wall biosynthesis
MLQQTVALVTPWFGEKIPGGAEAACRDIAKLLAAAGSDVEILTTCVRDFRSDWNQNHHPRGTTVECGLRVRRFPVRTRDVATFDRVNAKLMSHAPVSEAEEQVFVTEMVNSPELYQFIWEHRNAYVYLFIPYMFGTTYHGARVCPERSVLIPCLHDESYAHMRVFKAMFRSVRGALFLSEEEAAVARSLYGMEPDRMRVVGTPVDGTWTGDAARATAKYALKNFLLYAGRTDQGKNADMLADYFRRYSSESRADLELIFIGSQDAAAFTDYRIRSLGFVSSEDKHDLYAAALALCVPSVMESFSIVMMESWLASRPVIANAKCAVTTGFCRRSNGGLFFESYEEFREIVDTLCAQPALANSLGAQGNKYVRANFLPPIVASRYAAALAEWFSHAGRGHSQ